MEKNLPPSVNVMYDLIQRHFISLFRSECHIWQKLSINTVVFFCIMWPFDHKFCISNCELGKPRQLATLSEQSGHSTGPEWHPKHLERKSLRDRRDTHNSVTNSLVAYLISSLTLQACRSVCVCVCLGSECGKLDCTHSPFYKKDQKKNNPVQTDYSQVTHNVQVYKFVFKPKAAGQWPASTNVSVKTMNTVPMKR